jgi:hypothetical protein
MRAKLRWLQGYKLSANVEGTGSVPEGRKEGAYGQLQSVPLWERGSVVIDLTGKGSNVGQAGLAAAEEMITWRSGGE